jgi:hypothetical protein
VSKRGATYNVKVISRYDFQVRLITNQKDLADDHQGKIPDLEFGAVLDALTPGRRQHPQGSMPAC